MKHYLSVEAIDRLSAGLEPHTGAMIALLPSERDAEILVVPGYEDLDELHMTQAFLGSATMWDRLDRFELLAVMAKVAYILQPFEAQMFGRAMFNPTTSPCACYLIGGSSVADAHDLVWAALGGTGLDMLCPEQHEPWAAHMAIGYGLDEDELRFTGLPVMFDRLRIAFAADTIDLPLGR